MIRSLTIIFLLSIISLNIGPQGVLFDKLFRGELTSQDLFVLLELRVPRLILAIAVGGILSLSGLLYQSVFRNPLASPYTLGVSGGAALGVALGRGILQPYIPESSIWVLSFIGGSLVFFLLFPVITQKKRVSIEVVLLLGFLFSLFSGSLLFFLQYLMDSGGIVELTGWYFGTLSVVGNTVPLILLALSLLLLLYSYRLSPSLDLLLFGDEYAHSHGINTKKMLLLILSSTTICLAFTVSVVGPIGFLGLLVPHMCRELFGHAHKLLIPRVFIFGGGFLVTCDLLSRIMNNTQELPVGLVTALIGCPLMGILLLRKA